MDHVVVKMIPVATEPRVAISMDGDLGVVRYPCMRILARAVMHPSGRMSHSMEVIWPALSQNSCWEDVRRKAKIWQVCIMGE